MANYVTGAARGSTAVDSGDGARLFADGGKFLPKQHMLPPLPPILAADAPVQVRPALLPPLPPASPCFSVQN